MRSYFARILIIGVLIAALINSMIVQPYVRADFFTAQTKPYSAQNTKPQAEPTTVALTAVLIAFGICFAVGAVATAVNSHNRLA